MRNIKKTNKPTLPFVETFFKYMTCEREELDGLYNPKSKLNQPFSSVSLDYDSHNTNLVFEHPSFWNEYKQHIWKEYIKKTPDYLLTKATLPNDWIVERVFAYFENNNLLAIDKVRIQTKNAVKEEYFITVFYDIFIKLSDLNLPVIEPKIKTVKKEDNYNFEFHKIIKAKITDNGYLTLLFKQGNKTYFAKFNDFFTKSYEKSEKAFISQWKEIKESWKDNINLVDFNESFNDKDVFDFVFHLNNNNLWYGRLPFAITQEPDKMEWNKQGYIRLNKASSNTSYYQISNLAGLSITSLNKKINGKNNYYGNIVISARQGTTSIQEEGFNRYWPGQGSSAREENPISGNFSWIHFVKPNGSFYKQFYESLKLKDITRGAESLKNQVPSDIGASVLQRHFKIVFDKRNLTSSRWITKIFKVKWQIDRAPSNISQTGEINLNIPDYILTRIADGTQPGNVDYVFEQSSNFNYDMNWRELNFKVLIDGVNYGNTAKVYFRTGIEQTSDKLGIRCTKHLIFDLSYKVSTIGVNNTNKVFKLVVRDYEQNPNKLIFEEDKIITDIQDSKPAITINNLGAYIPVKKNGRWWIYFFESEYKGTTPEGLIVKTAPVRIGEILASTNNIELLKVKEFVDNSRSYLAVAHDNQAISFFYKNSDKHNNSEPDYLSYKVLFNYKFDFKYVPIYFKEQNIFRFVNTAPNVFKWSDEKYKLNSPFKSLNVRFDGNSYSKNNLPFLFSSYKKFDTVSENFKITTLEGTKKIANVNLVNSFVDNNTLFLSAILEQQSLKNVKNLQNFQTWKWLDNNNNVAFMFNKEIHKNQNENLTFNTNTKFDWIENGNKIDEYANKFTKIFKDPSNIEFFRCRHIKMKIKDNGRVFNYATPLRDANFEIDGNKLTIKMIFLPEKYDMGNYEISDFYIGDNETKQWRPIEEWQPINFINPHAIKYSFSYELELDKKHQEAIKNNFNNQ